MRLLPCFSRCASLQGNGIRRTCCTDNSRTSANPGRPLQPVDDQATAASAEYTHRYPAAQGGLKRCCMRHAPPWSVRERAQERHYRALICRAAQSGDRPPLHRYACGITVALQSKIRPEKLVAVRRWTAHERGLAMKRPNPSEVAAIVESLALATETVSVAASWQSCARNSLARARPLIARSPMRSAIV
jgi:hypothetical protein